MASHKVSAPASASDPTHYRVSGFYSDGQTSTCSASLMQVDAQGRIVILNDLGQVVCTGAIADVEISARLGQTPRYVDFASGGRFETTDHDVLHTITQRFKGQWWQDFVHRLERHMGLAAICALFAVLLGWGFWQYGVPSAANAIARALPEQTLDRAGRESLVLLDKLYFEESRLDPAWQAQLRAHMQPMLDAASTRTLNIQFRDGGNLGANALALPDGTIVFTDQIVQLAEHDDELLAVLAHEIGHIEARHSLRAIAQSTLLSVALTLVIGDASAMGDLAVNLPLTLAQSAHSREFEREADSFALAVLERENLNPELFVTLMTRLTLSAHCSLFLRREISAELAKLKSTVEETQDAADDTAKPTATLRYASDPRGMTAAETERCQTLIAKHDTAGEGLLGYFNSHPTTDERLAQFKR